MAQREPSHHLLTELDGHTVAGLPSPTEQQFAQRTSEGAQCLLSTAVNKKEPITPELFSQLAKKHGGPTADLKDLHFLFICLVRYTGFMRIDEPMQSHKQHVIISYHSMKIYVTGARTSTTRVPQCFVAHTNTPTCPVAITEWYKHAMGDSLTPNSHPRLRFVWTKKDLSACSNKKLAMDS